MNPDVIKQNVLKLQNAKASSADIDAYVKSATQELSPEKTKFGLPTPAPTFGGRLQQALTSAKDVGIGFAKTLGKDALNLAHFASTNPLLNPVGALGIKVPSLDIGPKLPTSDNPALQPKNNSQKVGGYLATGAELALPIGEGAKVAMPLLEEKSAKIAADKAIEMLSPKLTAKEAAEAGASRGYTKTGILQKIKLVADPYIERVAKTVKELVPDFSPSRTLAENVNSVKNAIGTAAEALKQKVISSGEDIIYPFKELASRLGSVEESISLKGTQFEKQIGPLKDAAIKLARDAGGKVSSLLDVRKDFDVLVNKTYPNLYDKEYSPIRSAVKAIRDELTNFTAEHLPKEVGLKDSLTQQSHLFTALENMAEKAASGVEKEVDTNVIGRASQFIQKHPVLSGLGATAAYEKAKNLPIIGPFLR